MNYDELESFLNWWMSNRYINTPQESSLTYQKDTHGVVLFRQNEYQVELFLLKPNSEIVAHKHPNVDSFEVYVSGDIKFMCDDKWYDQIKIGDKIRVKPNSWHGGLFGERGGCFLSVQKWLNGTQPSFVGNDWEDKSNNKSYNES